MSLTLKRIMALPVLGAMMFSLISFAPAIASANEGNNISSSVASPSVSMTDGKALVRGAKVTSVSGSTVNASVTWGSVVMNWTVNTDASTKYFNRLGKAGVFADIGAGDSISFAGTMSGNGMTVLASAIKDLSGTVTNATIGGKVQSINTGALSLVLSKGKDEHNQSPTLTVQTNASTTITMNGAALAFGAIQTGDTVKATGTLSADGATLSATALVIMRPASVNNGNFNQFIKDWFKGGNSGKGKGHDDN